MLPDLPTFGERIRWLRDEVLGLTTSKMADAAKAKGAKEASDASVSRWETLAEDVQPPPRADYVRVLVELAREAGRGDLTADWVLWGTQPTTKQPAPAQGQGRAEEVKPVADEERAQILTLLDVVRSLVAGNAARRPTPPIAPETLQWYREAVLRLDEIRRAAERPGRAPEDPGQTGTGG